MNLNKLKPSDAEKALPHTVHEKFQNTDKLAGALCVYCIGDEIEIVARGLKPRQIVKIFCLFISKIF
jgi:hypothetical protein